MKKATSFVESFNSLNIVIHLDREKICFVRELPDGHEDYVVSGTPEIADILFTLASSHGDGAVGLAHLSRQLNNLSLAIGRRAKQLERKPDGKTSFFSL